MEKNKKNRIISFIVTFFYSLMTGISFLCFYHNVVISSWLLEIIVSIVLLLALSLLSCKKIKTIILPIMMTIMIGIIYSFQSFYYGFFGIMNYIIECYNTKFEDARNMIMAASITSSHIQAMSLVIVIWMTYYIYHSIKKEKYTVLSILFFVLFSFTLWLDCFSFVGGALFSINALMVWMYHQNKVINTKTIQWFIILCIIFVSLAIPSYQDNLTIEQIKEDVLQQVDDLRYGKDNLPQGDLNRASRIHENNQERLEITVSQRKNLYLKGFVGSTLENNQWQDLTKASYNGEHEGMLKWLKKKKFSSTYQYNLYQKLSKNDDQKQNVTINNVAANKKYLYTPYSINQSDVTSSNIQKDLNLQSIALFGSKNYSYQETSSTSPSELMVGSDWLNNPNASQKEYLDTESIYRSFVYENYQTVDKGLEKTISQLFDQDDFENTGIYSVCQHIRDTMTSYLKYNDQISDKNSLKDFLNQKTAGNDVLFSTVAVEAFRYYDIPARYVEGYYLKSDAIDDEGNATLTSKDGHAWVEVYFDGMGWLPIDVTPGYYYDVYTLMNMVATPQGEQSDTNIEKGHQDSQSVDDGQNGGMLKRTDRSLGYQNR